MDGGDIGFGGLDRGQDAPCMNEKRFTFLRQHQPPRRPMQKLGPEAPLQLGHDAGDA
jgi:hypothetical protein